MEAALKSSISDSQEYRDACLRCATDDASFANFKNDPAFALWGVTEEQGREYHKNIISRKSGLIYMSEVNSPVSLRYAKVAMDLEDMFGSLDNMHIVEIGAGYGGQALILSQLCPTATFTLVDLAEAGQLQRRYLKECGCDMSRFEFTTMKMGDGFVPTQDYDLCISNYAFTECERNTQQCYINQIIQKSKRLYMTCNQIAGEMGVDSMQPGEYAGQFPNTTQILPEIPLTHPQNFILAFGHKTQPMLSFSQLATYGRFGNQLFEYAFTRLLAERHNRTALFPDWHGRHLFGLNDHMVMQQFPHHRETTYSLGESELVKLEALPPTLDIAGCFQYHTSYYAPHKDEIREWFTPQKAISDAFGAKLSALMRALDKKTLVCLHLRRGDYGKGMFFVPPNQWYLDWLGQIMPTLDSPLLYIASDQPNMCVQDFYLYSPRTAADLDIIVTGAEYFTDHWVLQQADAMAISNSTFGFTAAMLNRRCKTFVRPSMRKVGLVPEGLISFDPWGSEPMLNRDLGLGHLERNVIDQYPQPFASGMVGA